MVCPLGWAEGNIGQMCFPFSWILTFSFLYLGADLKERAKMDDAEVGHFVKRLRNLMDEIGKLLSQLGHLS